ncbi:MAG: hypothetical protein PHW19_05045, partial [Salinivirgaceae bacterium]|nr:hypothetical protein [Salinivirgaceae bacterium]
NSLECEVMFTPTTENSTGFMLMSDSLFTSKKIVEVDGIDFQIFAKNENINLHQQGTEASKFKIKGVVAINRNDNPTEIQISVVDSLGVLLQTKDIDSKTGYYEIDQIPESHFYIVFSGNNVRTLTRKVKIPTNYEHSAYYVDVALALSQNSNERVYDVVFESGETELSDFQNHVLQEWLKLNKSPVSDIWIRSAVVKKSKVSVLNKKRSVYLADLLNCKKIEGFVNYESDCELDQCIENRTYQIVISAKKYPKYRVEGYNEGATHSFQKSNTIFTIELERENEIHNLKRYAGLGVNTIWIDNSEATPKYCLGRFKDFSNALLMINELRNRGIRHMQIMTYDVETNRLSPLLNSTNMERNQNVSNNRYYVEIKASPVILETKNFPFKEKIRCVFDLNGIYHYIYGDYNLTDAKIFSTLLKEKGFGSANIVTITK